MTRSVLLLLVVVCCVPLSADADVVELKTGQRVEGALRQATSASVSIEIGGQVVTFDSAKVRAIYYGAAPTGPAAAASGADEALKALKALASVTSSNPSYRDYAPRVTDAKIIVDRYTQSAGDETAKAPLAAAIGFHVFAATAWNYSITNRGYRDLGLVARPVMNRCPALKNAVALKQTKGDDDFEVGFAVAHAVSAIWSCGADKIVEAERLLTGGAESYISQPSHGAAPGCPEGFALNTAGKMCVRQ